MLNTKVFLISCFLITCFLSTSASSLNDLHEEKQFHPRSLSNSVPTVLDNVDQLQDDSERDKREGYKLVKIELEKYKDRKPCDRPHINVEIKKNVDLGKIPKPSSVDLVHKFKNLVDYLYSVKTDLDDHYDHSYKEKSYEKPRPYSDYHHDEYYHRHYPSPAPERQYAKYPEPPKYKPYPTTTTTTQRPYSPYEPPKKPSYQPVNYYEKPEPQYRFDEDKSYSYVKSNYEKMEEDYQYPKPARPVYSTPTTKKPYTTTTTTERPYKEYKPEPYPEPERYSFEAVYQDYEPDEPFYSADHYEKPKEEYPVYTERPYKQVEPPKYYETTTKKYVTPSYSTPKPYTSYSKVKSEVYSNDRPKSSYPEPYYDFVKHLEKEYPRKYASDFVDYYENNKKQEYYKEPEYSRKPEYPREPEYHREPEYSKEPEYYRERPKVVKVYPCKVEYSEPTVYDLPVSYNPNRYESLYRKDSPVHDTSALLKNFERKDLYYHDTNTYVADDRDDYRTPYNDRYSHDYHNPNYLTKRKTAIAQKDKAEIKEVVRKEQVPDWEQTKVIAGNGELHSHVNEEIPESFNTNDETQLPESKTHQDEDDADHLLDLEKKNEYEKIVKTIITEIGKIKEELHRREKLENFNRMHESIDDSLIESVFTTDDDIKVKRSLIKEKLANKYPGLLRSKSSQETTKVQETTKIRQPLFLRKTPENSKSSNKN